MKPVILSVLRDLFAFIVFMITTLLLGVALFIGFFVLVLHLTAYVLFL